MGVGWLKESFVSIWRHCTGTRTETGGKHFVGQGVHASFRLDLSVRIPLLFPIIRRKPLQLADMSGNLLHKSDCIPITDEKQLKESAPAVAQGWRSFISFSPDKKLLVTVTQLGDVLDIYNMENGRHTTIREKMVNRVSCHFRRIWHSGRTDVLL